MPEKQEKLFQRQWRIIRVLAQAENGLHLDELAERLKLNPRTIQRYFAFFREIDIPLVEEKDPETGRKKYSLASDSAQTLFTLDELLAVYTSRRFLEPMMGSFLWDAMQKAIEKMRKSLGSKTVRYLERSIGTFAKTDFGWSDYSDRTGLIDELINAIEKRNMVVISYRSLNDDDFTPTKVSPFGLVHHEGSLYLIGHSHKRNEIRHWKLDRMKSATLTDEMFSSAEDFSLEEHLKNLFGIYQSSKEFPEKTVRIRFEPGYSRRIREKRWHTSESFEEQRDGGVIMELRIGELSSLKSWILSFGRHAEVVEPTELREIVLNEIENICEFYVSNNDI